MKKHTSLVLVSADPKSLSYGASDVLKQLEWTITQNGLQDRVHLDTFVNGGKNDAVPFVIIYPEAVVYGPIQPGDVPRLVDEHINKGNIIKEFLVPARYLGRQLGWLGVRQGANPMQTPIVLERVGHIDPENIEDYILHNGYKALRKTLSDLSPAEVIDEIQHSGLRGRGGAGFPTGVKWNFVSKAQGQPKFIICNADESEPGTFKDRVILEEDPFSVIEAMTISAYAVGASEGYIYIRGEYSRAKDRIQNAIAQAEKKGLLGDNILGTDFSFRIHVHSGAGAYICGEETALIESLEGKRGEPRNRPPYPVTWGLWGKPSVVNNVETLANVPAIIRNGAAWFSSYGTLNSPGTKVFTILGNINKPGLVEVPLGITLREIIGIYAKGMQEGSRFKMAQTGGSSGSLIPASLQDTPLDFDSYRSAGVTLGSGAMLICDEFNCAVDFAKTVVNFFQKESCGKCTPCRVGNQRAYQILDNISDGIGSMQDIQNLTLISENLINLSNCGLGQTAGVPLRDILYHFRAEVEAHIRLQVCPTGNCQMRKVYREAYA